MGGEGSLPRYPSRCSVLRNGALTMERVVITGTGAITPLGQGMKAIHRSLRESRSGVRYMAEWDEIVGLHARIAGRVADFSGEMIDRKYRRTMDRVAQMAAAALDSAIRESGLEPDRISHPRTGISFGSAMGGLETLTDYLGKVEQNHGFVNMRATAFLRFMSHTVSANLAVMYNVVGRNIPTCSACTASSQAIGVGFEEIRSGRSDVMFCGGAEGLHFTQAGVFDSMGATARNWNDRPEEASRPFDRARNGLVISEGAGAVVLESLSHARARGATILGEIVGYATNCDGGHITLPEERGMNAVMRAALADAGLEKVDYINAHATGTEKGDESESLAIYDVFGDRVPVSSTKGYTGHMFGGGGAVEALISLLAIREGFLPANRNLEEPGAGCAPLNYLFTHRDVPVDTVMNNNFAFGGINTSMILKKFQ